MESETVEDNTPYVSTPEPPANDDTKIVNAPAGTCPTCGEPIVRLPGARGRAPKYHPECRPSKTTRQSAPRITVASKLEAAKTLQVDAIVSQYERMFNKVILLLAVVEPYDALVIKVNMPDVLTSMRDYLMSSDRALALASAVGTGSSITQLIMSILSIALPIGAHHGALGKGKLANFILNVPVMMMRMNDASAQSETGDFTMDLLAMAKQRHEEEKRKRRGNNVDESEGVS